MAGEFGTLSGDAGDDESVCAAVGPATMNARTRQATPQLLCIRRSPRATGPYFARGNERRQCKFQRRARWAARHRLDREGNARAEGPPPRLSHLSATLFLNT